jgi:cytochrome c-type biogenesis protein CcsB
MYINSHHSQIKPGMLSVEQKGVSLRAEPLARCLRVGAPAPWTPSAGTPRASKNAARHTFLLLALVLGLIGSSGVGVAAELSRTPDEVKAVLVQHNGRVKTFDAFARQTLRLIAGKEKWQKRAATDILWSIALDRRTAGDLEWIRLDLPELKTRVGADAERHFFSLNELAHSFPEVMALAQSAQAKRDKDERPSAMEQKAQQLLGRMHTVNLLVTGELFTVVPAPADSTVKAWYSGFADDSSAKLFRTVLKDCSQAAAAHACGEAVGEWNNQVLAMSKDAANTKVGLELFYLSFHPFLWAWLMYLAGWLVLLCGVGRPVKGLGISLVAAGWLFHTLGLALRTIVLDRPPVSNMYESMIFMNWALMLFAFGFAAVRRTSAPLAAGALISALIEIYANLLPIDPSMDVLVPVLRSNYWLTVHVLTVVASYGAFGLALALGHRHLIFDRILKRWSAADSDASARLILRIIEFGAILLGVGTVLGGVWANESWGRFWGWDPKETWALITLLGYLAIIHLRYFKKIGPFGLAVSTIVGFQLVLFTWYGVNFVLGRGLHSYGSGSGGMEWILYYLAAQSVFVVWIFLKKK